jgi:small nuclear ribonucleoprotein (snRNP)-like protein
MAQLACAVKLNANRHVTGVLRGFDQFMNLVLDNTVDEKLKADLGMVVSCTVQWRFCSGSHLLFCQGPTRVLCVLQVIRGNSIITIEALERVDRPMA